MTDVGDAHPAQVQLAGVFTSVNLLGPPMSDKLVRLVVHLFSPEEAEVARHLPFYYPRSLATVARRAGRSPAVVKPLLDAMSERRVIVGIDDRYSLIPLIPGMFEYVLVDGRDSEWHREYARLLIDLIETGYLKKYNQQRVPAVRNIPIQTAVENKNRAVESDFVSEMIDSHTDMSVATVCQCRQSARFMDKRCKRSAPEDGCLLFGTTARAADAYRSGRLVSKEEMRDIVAERYAKKLVFMTGNVAPGSSNAICTCCACCCHGLKAIHEYDGMAVMAEAHYLAEVDLEKCKKCGKCTKACNTHAHIWKKKQHIYRRDRCIGCGLCAQVCEEGAIRMVENSSFRPPSSSFGRLGLRLLPGVVMSGIRARISR